MPWEVSTVLDQRMAFLAAARQRDLSMAQLCRDFGISRPTGYKWLRRWQEDPAGGVADRSCAPRTHPHRLAEDLAQEILRLRLHHPTWGPRKLRAALQRESPQQAWPAPSTIGELLRHHALSEPRGQRRRAHATPPLPLTPGNGPNEVCTLDDTGHFALGAGTRCHPLTVQDTYSRLLLACQALAREDFASAQPLLVAAFHEFGLPQVIRSDNGAPFAAAGLIGLTRLAVWLLRLGLRLERIAPAHPEQNGRD